MEQVRGIHADPDNDMIYLAVEINKNKYHNRTVYDAGSDPGFDNSNVAIIAYSWTHGVMQWTSVIGNPEY